MQSVYICGAKRTHFGAFGGALAKMSATELAAHASAAAIQQANVAPHSIDTVVFGNVAQTSPDAAYLARHAALRAQVPVATPALVVNRLCGSGFEAVAHVARDIQLGAAEVGLAGGAESMSQAPMAAYGQNVRFATRLGSDLTLVDTLWAGLTDSLAGCPMGITAENLATDHAISRAESDAYALRSQERWAAAHAAGRFGDELAPMSLPGKKGNVEFAADEHPRQTTPEKMAKLASTFKKDGTVTAASASGICDGAAALVVASESAVARHGLSPLAELVCWATVGVDPTRMGIGPVPAIQQALDKSKLSLEQMGLIEINEAFAPQVLACAKELGIDPSKLNIDGGAISLGHPLGASGARITAHLAHAIARGEAEHAIGAACIGGGQGIALILKAAK